MTSRSYRKWVGGFVVLGVALRLVYVLALHHGDQAGGDAYYYHWQAILNVRGHWWINPYYYFAHSEAPTAGHPPLFTVLLMLPSVFGLQSYLWHLCFNAVFGGVTIAVMAGFANDLAGRRAGVVAAALAALYPLQIINDTRAMSESLTATTVVLTLWAGYSWWKKPDLTGAIFFGLAIGMGILTRAEVLTLAPLAAIALMVSVARRVSLRRALVGMAIAASISLATIAPWVYYNMHRFALPVYISNGFGPTLGSANCDLTYKGEYLGYWNLRCMADSPSFVEESTWEKYWRDRSFDYIDAHRGELPRVLSARIGRMFFLFRPIQQMNFDEHIELREWWLSAMGYWHYWLMVPLSAAGCLILRRRRIPWFPAFAPVIVVVLTAITAFGQTRYRVTSDAAMVPIAAIALGAIIDLLLEHNASPTTEVES